MKSHHILFIAALSGSLLACEGDKSSQNDQVDALFSKYNSKTTPGCALAVIENGAIVYKKGYGMANLEYDIPNTTATVFDIASVSKQFAGLAISTLVQEGKISLDDDIRKYLPYVPDFGRKITIQHLVDHTSGLRDWPQTLNVAGWRWDEDFLFEDIVRMVKKQKDLDFDPGSKFSYSNTGYNMLAAIVEKISGKSFREWSDENIFKPLAMNNSHFLDNHKAIIRNMAYSYSVSEGEIAKSPSALTAYGSSSLFTTVDDLCLWVIHFEKQIAAKNPIYLRMLTEGILNNGEKTQYAFGLGLDMQGGLQTVSHNGGWAGYRTAIVNFPNERISVIVLSNASDFDSDGAALDVAKIFLKGKFKEESKGDVKQLPTVSTNVSFAKKCEGMYQLGPGWYVTISLDGDTLKTQASNEPEFPMVAKSDSVYWIDGYNAAMTFVTDKNGEVNSLRYKWISSAKRVSPIAIDTSSFAAYAGIYHSEELSMEYTVSASNGKLTMFQIRLGEIDLSQDPVTPNQFSSRVGTVKFVGEKKFSGFLISGGRVKNLRFDKR
ncbi:MAG TPA: serine hydrolase domain-containing protein [Cyclobacteriaceae bacterium]|nr:serine hydrolase domain-containing protein [Cyclobacteriaceae bacterium]